VCVYTEKNAPGKWTVRQGVCAASDARALAPPARTLFISLPRLSVPAARPRPRPRTAPPPPPRGGRPVHTQHRHALYTGSPPPPVALCNPRLPAFTKKHDPRAPWKPRFRRGLCECVSKPRGRALLQHPTTHTTHIHTARSLSRADGDGSTQRKRERQREREAGGGKNATYFFSSGEFLVSSPRAPPNSLHTKISLNSLKVRDIPARASQPPSCPPSSRAVRQGSRADPRISLRGWRRGFAGGQEADGGDKESGRAGPRGLGMRTATATPQRRYAAARAVAAHLNPLDTPPCAWATSPGRGRGAEGARSTPREADAAKHAERPPCARALPLAPAAVVEEHCRRAHAVAAPSLIPPLLRSHWRLRG